MIEDVTEGEILFLINKLLAEGRLKEIRDKNGNFVLRTPEHPDETHPVDFTSNEDDTIV